MFDRTERRRLKRIFYSRITLVVLVVVTLVFAHSVWGIFEKVQKTETVKNLHQEELTELKQRAGALQERIETLGTERGVEAELRRKFDVAKEGEHVIVLVEPKETRDSLETEEERGMWSSVKDFFGF